MFVPTEGMGACIARIVSECGLCPTKMEFREDSAVVEFKNTETMSSRTSPLARTPTHIPHNLPPEGWKKEGHKWRNGTYLMSSKEISVATGIPNNALRQRLYSRGRIETIERTSKFNRISKRKRFAHSETQKE